MVNYKKYKRIKERREQVKKHRNKMTPEQEFFVQKYLEGLKKHET